MSNWEQSLESDVKGLEPTSGKGVAEDAALAAVVGGVAYEGYEYEQKKKAQEAAAQQTDQTIDPNADPNAGSGF